MQLLFASGRRTVSSWLRAGGLSKDYRDYYYFLACVGRNVVIGPGVLYTDFSITRERAWVNPTVSKW